MTDSSFDALQWLTSRRSATALTEPGPSDDQVQALLRAALSVPDHGLIRPFRVVVVSGEARARFGEALAGAASEQRPGAPPEALEKLRQKAFMAPAQFVLISSPQESQKVPRWEQQATAACVGYALLLAAHALGLGAVWKSSLYCDGRLLRELLRLREGEQMLGWINVGTSARPLEAPRADRSTSDFATILR